MDILDQVYIVICEYVKGWRELRDRKSRWKYVKTNKSTWNETVEKKRCLETDVAERDSEIDSRIGV